MFGYHRGSPVPLRSDAGACDELLSHGGVIEAVHTPIFLVHFIGLSAPLLRLPARVVGLQAERTFSSSTSASGNVMFVIMATAS